MAEAKTIARPYAEAAFALAQQRKALKPWSEMLALAAAVAADPSVARLATDPKTTGARLLGLFLSVCGERLDAAGQNLVRVLVENRRLALLPEIAAVYEDLKNAAEARVEATVVSAFELDAAQIKKIEEALKRRLNRDVRVTTAVDRGLLGGLFIRANDLVIDASVRGQLARLAANLNS
jgi:F-type H+-transporting ATPase subunit delta